MAARTCGYPGGIAGDYTDLDTCAAGISAGDVVTVHPSTAAGNSNWLDAFTLSVASTWQPAALGGSGRISLHSDASSGHPITVTANATISGFDFCGDGTNAAHGIYINTASLTVAINNCLFLGCNSAVQVGSSGTSCAITITGCLAISCYHGFIANACGAGTTLTINHCGAVRCLYGYRRVTSGVMPVANSYGYGNATADFNGTFGTANNNASLDGTHPGTAGVALTPATIDRWLDMTASACPLDFRPDATSALVGAGTAGGGLTDFYGRTFNASASTIGPVESWPLATHPAANKIETGTSCVLLDGTTRDGSLSPDYPDVGNVRDTDTVNGSAGTLASNKILKSNATGSGAGSYDDDNLSVGNVRPVAFGVGLTGTLANLAAGDVAYVALEASRNVSAGAGNILAGAYELIAGVQIAGTFDADAYALAVEAVRNTAANPAKYLTGNSFTQFGATVNGSYAPDFPAVENVAPDDTVNGTPGTMDLPALAKVAPSDTLRGVAGTMDLPAINKVAPSDTLEGVAGTMDIPSTANVLSTDTLEGVAGRFDAEDIDTEAEWETNVAEGVTGGLDGAWTGAHSGGGGTALATPTLTVPNVDLASTADVTATVADATAGTTNAVYYKLRSASTWTLGGSRSGNGAVTFTLPVGSYDARITSTLGEASTLSAQVEFVVSNSATEKQYYRVRKVEWNPGSMKKTITLEKIERPANVRMT